MYWKNERRELLKTMLNAIERIRVCNINAVHIYSTALIHLTSMDYIAAKVISTYIEKLENLENAPPSDNLQQLIRDFGDEYNKAIHRIHGKGERDEIIDHHGKKITKEFLNKNYYPIQTINKEKFEIEYHQKLIGKMILANDNINIDSDTTFLAHEYVNLLLQIGNSSEYEFVEIIWTYEEEEERCMRFNDDLIYWKNHETQFEIKNREILVKDQQKLLDDLESGYNQALEYFVGKKEWPNISFKI